MFLFLLFHVSATQFAAVTQSGNELIISDETLFAYIDLDTCPILTYYTPTNSTWTQFCQNIQNTQVDEPTTLDVRQMSAQATKLSQDPRYVLYKCTQTYTLTASGTNACCCVKENIDTELSTQGLTAVIVVPLVFFFGGLIMAKLNAHNSRSAWIHEFEQAQLKA